MEIIAHRGLWLTAPEKNTLEAIRRAVEAGFGVELDVRDQGGRLVISHEIPAENVVPFEEALEVMQGKSVTLAINIKADGLASHVSELLKRYRIERYFAFDMSSPELFAYTQEHVKSFARLSSWESLPPYPVSGLWVDALEAPMPDKLMEQAARSGQPMCVVSEELHGRSYTAQWALLKKLNAERCMLCTDHSDLARRYFNA